MPAATPSLVPQPFATSGDRNSIPDTSADPQRARYAQGFPAATMTPVDAGGVPMLGPDMNGILFDVTAWLFALQGGQLPAYGADVSDAIGGYAQGAIIAMADADGYWLNIVNANTTDPDAGGDGWRPLYAYGAANISGLTGGVRELTAVEASRPMLILTGVLVANQQIVLPNVYQSWLIINRCTGGFTMSVRNPAGDPLIIPAGGSASPSLVYCDAESHMSPVFAPTALPTSVTPVADTIVLRDNTGRQFATAAPVGTSTTQVASTAFVNPGTTLGTNGFRKFPDGTMAQWGQAGGAGSNITVNFPTAFTAAPYSVQLTPRIASGDALGQVPTLVGTPGVSSFVFAPADGSIGTHWTAWGRWSPP